MKNPTLADVAQNAGVSYATADRVVNKRGNVAVKSVEKVQNAVAQLGYVRNVSAAKLSRGQHQKLAFVLPKRSHSFFERMHAQLSRIKPHLKRAQVSCDVVEFEAFKAGSLEDALTGLLGLGYSGVAFVGQGGNEGGNDASDVLNALRSEGVKTVSLVSDTPVPSRDHYIGINNFKAGRTAARLVGMAHRGDRGHVVVTAGSMGLRDHFDRIAGFRAVLETDFPAIRMSEVIETKDSASSMQNQLGHYLAENDDVTAIYNAGAGNEGVVDAVHARALSASLFCVVHELSDAIRDALENGIIDIVIDQRPEIEMARAAALLQAITDDLPPPPSPELIPAIYLRDNLPAQHI